MGGPWKYSQTNICERVFVFCVENNRVLGSIKCYPPINMTLCLNLKYYVNVYLCSNALTDKRILV